MEEDFEDGEQIADLTPQVTRSPNPYAEELQKLLRTYMQQEETRAVEKKRILDEATRRLLQRSQPDKYESAAEAFKIAAAFGKPTRTGAFGETLSNVSETAAGLLEGRAKSRRELEDLQMKYKLAGLDVDQAGQQAKMQALGTLARSQPREQQQRLTETERLIGVIEDPTSSAAAKREARARLDRLQYIPPTKQAEAKEPGALSPAGRIASDEGLRPGTSEFQTRVRQLTGEGRGGQMTPAAEKQLFELEDKNVAGESVIANLERALEINAKAYSGPLAGARRTAARIIPGLAESEGVVATTELENIVIANALGQLRAVFGGMPTEGERAILIQLQGSINMTPAERAIIFRQAKEAAQRRIEANKNKINSLKSGSYRNSDEGFAKGGRVAMERGGLNAANLARSAAQGFSLGYSDEAMARVRAKMEGRPYEEVLAEERENLRKFQERYPFTALGTEMVGGAVPIAATMMMPGGQALSATRAAGLAKRIPGALKGPTGRMAASGGATGFVAGTGTSEEEGMGRLGDGFTGGVTGAVAGPLVGHTVSLGGSGLGRLYDKMKPQGARESRAMEKVLEAMARDETSPAQARARLARDENLGVPSMLMDVSPSLKTLGEATVTMPGGGRRILGEPLEARLAEGRERVASRSLQTVGKGVDFTTEEASMVGRLRANANNAYEQAYARGSVNDPRIMRVLEDDTFKKAFDEARSIANTEARTAQLRGEDPSKYMLQNLYEVDPDGNIVKIAIPDVRTLDYIKRGIDSLIDKGYKGAGMSTAQASALKDLKKEFVRAIDDNVPEYAAARAQYAGDIEVLDALRFGREKFLTPKTLPAQAKNMVAEMSVAERDALRAGVAQALLTKVTDAPQQINAAQRVIGSPATQKRLEALFDNPQEYTLFKAALEREADLFRNAQEVLRNSRTANRQEAIKDLKKTEGVLDVAGEVIDISNAGTGAILGRVLRFMRNHATLDEQTAGEVAKILRTGSVQEMDQLMTQMERQARSVATRQGRRETTRQATAAETGLVMGSPPPSPQELPDEDQ